MFNGLDVLSVLGVVAVKLTQATKHYYNIIFLRKLIRHGRLFTTQINHNHKRLQFYHVAVIITKTVYVIIISTRTCVFITNILYSYRTPLTCMLLL